MNIPQDYALGVDVWEGALDIDEPTLKAAGVEFILIRMNDTVGGEHLDENFLNQWEQAKGFGRGAYFVVADWMTLESQLNFIIANLPADCTFISLDVELHYSLAPDQYAALLNGLIIGLQQRKLNVVVYTGGGYVSIVNPWPKDVNYWWARYPSYLYPDTSVEISWDVLKSKLSSMNWGPGVTPGPCVCWQCTADRFKLPGCAGRAIDINVMPRAQFDKYFPAQIEEPEPQPDPLEARVSELEVEVKLLTEDRDKLTNIANTQGTQLTLMGLRLQKLEDWASTVIIKPFVK